MRTRVTPHHDRERSSTRGYAAPVQTIFYFVPVLRVRHLCGGNGADLPRPGSCARSSARAGVTRRPSIWRSLISSGCVLNLALSTRQMWLVNRSHGLRMSEFDSRRVSFDDEVHHAPLSCPARPSWLCSDIVTLVLCTPSFSSKTQCRLSTASSSSLSPNAWLWSHSQTVISVVWEGLVTIPITRDIGAVRSEILLNTRNFVSPSALQW